jgi:cobalt-zinc-cadmium efflux system membrane fusion protein
LGQVVQPSDELFVVADLSKVYAVAEVPERQIDLIEKGQEVDILIPSINEKPIKGKLVYVSDIVNPETLTVMVRSELSNTSREIKPDMLVSMLVQSKPISKVSVPVKSIIRENDKNYVFVQISPNKYRLREVDVGDEFNGMVAIVSGVEEGETIVSDGAFHLNNERKRKELE